MNDKEKRPTSGFVAGFGGECGFSAAQHDSGFSNLSEVYVSKSGFSRLLSAVRYGKRYMLKCLKPDFAFTPVYRQALMKEFEIGLQLDHPNICRTISMEPVEELGECIVMEYVDGENLETAVTSGTFTEEKARKIAAQLLDAMEYMHAKQTVHRDIKPSNIMVTHREHRPSDIAQIRRLLAGKSKSFAVVNAVLVALIALLLVVIGVMTNARQDTRPETVATDSVATDGVNRVVDSNLW